MSKGTISNYGASTGKNKPRPLGVAHARGSIDHRPEPPMHARGSGKSNAPYLGGKKK